MYKLKQRKRINRIVLISGTILGIMILGQIKGNDIQGFASTKEKEMKSFNNSQNKLSNEELLIKDTNLRIQIKKILKKQFGSDELTKSSLKKINNINIQEFDLPDSDKIESLSGIENLDNLESLVITYSSITDISPLKSLKTLKTVNLKGARIKDFSPLVNHINLEKIVLDNSPISNLEGIEKLSKLKFLSLQSSLTVDDQSLMYIKKLANLETLLLGNNQISNIDSLGSLSNLKSLSLSNNKITNIDGLKNLKLDDLRLEQNSISNIEGISHISTKYNVTDQKVLLLPKYFDNNTSKSIIIDNPIIADNGQNPDLIPRNKKTDIYHTETKKMEWNTAFSKGNQHANWKDNTERFSGEIVQPFLTSAVFKSSDKGNLKDNSRESSNFKKEITISFEQGSNLKLKDIPEVAPNAGYEFDHWEDNNGYKISNWNDIYLNTNMEFWAQFKKIEDIKNKYQIIFDSNGGSKVNSIFYTKDQGIDQFPIPKKEGYIFEGWYDGEKLIQCISVGSEGDIKLMAHWTATEYHVDFDSAGGSKVDSLIYTIEKGIESLPTPTKDGFTFAGWYDGEQKVGKIEPGKGNKKLTARWDKNELQTKPTNPDKLLLIYRLYNKNTGEHFYTESSFERDSLVKGGWNNEGTGWSAPQKGIAVYRVYNPNAKGGDHYYTASKYEANSLVKTGWKWDNGSKPVFYSGGKTPVYVAFNPNAKSGSHNYTQNKFEQNFLLNNGWNFASTAFYGG